MSPLPASPTVATKKTFLVLPTRGGGIVTLALFQKSLAEERGARSSQNRLSEDETDVALAPVVGVR